MTQTEKVDASKSGWEIWVDESLMNNQNQFLNKSNQSKAINFNQSYNSNSNNNMNNLLKKTNSEEGSLTGIGSFSNYKPPQSNLKLSSTSQTSGSLEKHKQTDLPSIAQQPKFPTATRKSQIPVSSSSNNTPQVYSSQSSNSRMHIPLTSSKSPGIPYAHAYELFGRQVTRIQLPNSHPQSQPPTNIPRPPSQKKPQQQPLVDVCLECMMRDRDMAGVDVLGPGVWARESDADFEQAMLDEATTDQQDPQQPDLDRRPSVNHTISSTTGDDFSEDTQSNRKSSTTQPHSEASTQAVLKSPQAHPIKKRIGKGQLLTMPALKAWTQMNPPATAHRWRTLQLFLREQRHYIDLEQQAKRSIELENQRSEDLFRIHPGSFAQPKSHCISTDSPSLNNFQFLRSAPSSRPKVTHRTSSATLLTNGMLLETLDISKDESEAKKYRDNAKNLSSSTSSKRISSSSSALRNRDSRSPKFSSINLNPLSPSSELPNENQHLPSSSATPQLSRPPSPTRFSFVSRKSAPFGETMRPFSRWARARRSGSNSVVSLAPSGSLLDLHVGLSHDPHNLSSLPSPHDPMSLNRSMLNFHPPGGIPLESQYTHKPSLASLTSSPTASRFNGVGESRVGNQKHEKKNFRHTLKGLWSKLGKSRNRSCSIDLISSPTPLGTLPTGNRGNVRSDPEEELLAPPPPLSALAREQQSHRRTRSTLSLPLVNACRFGPFRPQSVSTTNPGLDSTASSPMSQNFIPSSPRSKFTVNGTGTTRNLSTTHMNSPHGPQFDALAEELEMAPCETSSSSASRLKNRARSLGTMSLLSGASVSEEVNKKSQRKTAIEPRNSQDGSNQENGGPVVCSDLHGSQEAGSGVGMMNTNAADPVMRSNGNRASSSSLSIQDKAPNSSTLMSISSKVLSKLPGLKNRRTTSSGLISQLNSNHSTNTTGTPATTTNGRHDNLRSSASSTQFSTPLPPLDPISHCANMDPDFHNSQIDSDHHQLDPKDYLPLEKGRHAVSGSSDFLALRYVSLGRDERNQ